MAPHRRKKQLNSSCLAKEEQHPSKRKKHIAISLEWDDQSGSVVAKRQQIGILHTHIAPFTDDLPPSHTNLAGLLNLPSPTFDLNDLTGVLSYEVWHSHFSDSERTILTQYLPRGAHPDTLVQQLLSGDNFHFGNPFLKWGASLCSGKLHPDQVLHREQYIKANKKMYLSELQKYHNDMIESLQRWKDTLDRCKEPQEEALQNIWKSVVLHASYDMSRKQSEKRMDLCEMLYHNEDDDVNTPESSDRATSDKACSNNFLHIPGDCHKRNVLTDSNVNEAPDGPKVAVKPQTEEKAQKRNVQLGDGAKYMSYNKPFEIFEEEERQKLHDYWFRLATKDFPAFYANWRERKLKTQELVKSLCQDLEEKLKLQEKFLEQDDENSNSHNLSPAELADNVDTAVSPNASALEDEKIEVSHTFTAGQMANQVGSGEVALSLENEENEKTDYTHERQKYDGVGSMEEDDGSNTLSAREEDGKMAAINFRPQVTDMTVDSHGSDIIDNPTVILSELPGNMSHINIPGAVGNDAWSAVTVPGSFYHPAALDHEYACPNEFSLTHPQPALMIDLEAEAQEQGTRRDTDDLCFHDSFIDQQCRDVPEKSGRQPEHVSFFSGYPTHEALLRAHGGLLAYQPAEQKRMGFGFDEAGSVMAENGQFAVGETRQKRMNEMNFEECVYPNGGRYCIAKQSPGNPEDWGVESQFAMGQSWFPGENQGRRGWPGLESGATLSRSSNLDQTLFSVLSECDELRAATSMPYGSMAESGMCNAVEQSSEAVRKNNSPSSLEWHIDAGFLRSWNQY